MFLKSSYREVVLYLSYIRTIVEHKCQQLESFQTSDQLSLNNELTANRITWKINKPRSLQFMKSTSKII